MHFQASIVSLAIAVPAALACQATGGIPEATDHISNPEVIEIGPGEVFDGQFARYDRGPGACQGQQEGDWEDAVFVLRGGSTLKNVIIGADQAEGVHCDGSCTIENVWFEQVCEDAISVKNDNPGDVTNIVGGGAYRAEDKIIQHNGCGTVNIINFYAEDYGKVYRSCGNCNTQCQRTVHVEGVSAYGGGEVVGINEAFGDVATLVDVCTDASEACWVYDGCEGGCSPQKLYPC